ncbi:macro domain-containing protein [Butyrivibrio proteoclasticus]|uniref:macro domain-containing protein n=1 Tax=Butyrivibrio proteoclasticus TaxID=43305 RepID=UPI00047ABEA1|nr:macro domain-containing protein [Butyrivibrio proteoclasticus]
MPFQIIRNDITKVKADAIVNTANPEVFIGGGVDTAIYNAAGREQLLAEREKIGELLPGEAAVTPAFNLDAKYIIHVSGPKWEDGEHGEFDILRNCYEKALSLAVEKECESIAFPLIATGAYGFPKDKALQIATSVIQQFLFENEMSIILVVFDRKAFELSGKVYSDVQGFIDENYVKRSYRKEYGERGERNLRLRASFALDDTIINTIESDGCDDTGEDGALSDEKLMEPVLMARAPEGMSLDELLDTPAQSFQERLFSLIDKSGLDDVTVYKRANISKKVFSDIKTKKNYKPSKKTAVAFAIALELTMDETADLLQRAGIALSPSSKFDLIVGYYISHGMYNIMEINTVLFKNNQECLGAIK